MRNNQKHTVAQLYTTCTSYKSTKKLSQNTKAYTKAKEGLAEVGLHAGLITFTEPIKYYRTHKASSTMSAK